MTNLHLSRHAANLSGLPCELALVLSRSATNCKAFNSASWVRIVTINPTVDKYLALSQSWATAGIAAYFVEQLCSPKTPQGTIEFDRFGGLPLETDPLAVWIRTT
jgi:hypothetical protein